MLSRSFLVPLLATGFLAAPAAADRLFVAGAEGFVLSSKAVPGSELQYFTCFCGSGVIEALAADGQHLYTAGEQGQLVVFDLESGALQSFLAPSQTPIRALAVSNGNLFAGNDAGEVLRVDTTSGSVSARSLPARVRAMTAHNGFLYVAASDGGIYRARALDGEFEYWTCFCLFQVQDMVVSGPYLMVGDGLGSVVRVSLETGFITSSFWVGAMDTMTVSRGAVLTHSTANLGVIQRFSATTGEKLSGSFTVPALDLRAMLVVREETGAVGTQAIQQAPGLVRAP